MVILLHGYGWVFPREILSIVNNLWASGFSGMEWWTGMVEWTGMEWNVDKLDGFNGLSPPYNDHL